MGSQDKSWGQIEGLALEMHGKNEYSSIHIAIYLEDLD